MPNEREDYLAEDNAVARECFKVLSPEAREAMTAGDICVLVGLAAEARRRGVKRYRAELTAPAEGDVEAAEDLWMRVFGSELTKDIQTIDQWRMYHEKTVKRYLAAALTDARRAERSKVPPPDEIHRDGYNLGKADAEARVKALEAENLGLRKTVGVDGKEIAELRADLAAALLAGEGKGEE